MSLLAPPLILASGSPRRRELLQGLGYSFTVVPASIDESPLAGEKPTDYVTRLARSKAGAVRGDDAVSRAAIVLAADTIVAQDGALLGKPRDDEEAASMLRRLAGAEHDVLTGIAVTGPGEAVTPTAAGGQDRFEICHVERTRVRFAPMTEAEIDWYVATGEPRDKAGAYGIQGFGALFVESIVGNYSNVVGLPLPATYRLLAAAGYPRTRATTGPSAPE